MSFRHSTTTCTCWPLLWWLRSAPLSSGIHPPAHRHRISTKKTDSYGCIWGTFTPSFIRSRHLSLNFNRISKTGPRQGAETHLPPPETGAASDDQSALKPLPAQVERMSPHAHSYGAGKTIFFGCHLIASRHFPQTL